MGVCLWETVSDVITNTERMELERLSAEKQKEEATNEQKLELRVIALELDAKKRVAIVVVLERVRITRFAHWIETDPYSRVDLSNPSENQRAVYETETVYKVLHVELVPYTRVVAHLNRHVAEAMTQTIITLESTGAGRAIISLLREQGFLNVYPVNVADRARTRKKDGEWFVSLKTLNENLNEVSSMGMLKLDEDSPEASSAIGLALFVASRHRTVPIISPGTVKTRW